MRSVLAIAVFSCVVFVAWKASRTSYAAHYSCGNISIPDDVSISKTYERFAKAKQDFTNFLLSHGFVSTSPPDPYGMFVGFRSDLSSTYFVGSFNGPPEFYIRREDLEGYINDPGYRGFSVGIFWDIKGFRWNKKREESRIEEFINLLKSWMENRRRMLKVDR